MTDEQKKLATDNHKLIYAFLHKYNYDKEDFYDLAAIGLCKAAKSYNTSMGTFSTLAYKCMFNEISSYFACQGAARRIPEYMIMNYDTKDHYEEHDHDLRLDLIGKHECFENETIINMLIDNCKTKLSDRDRLVFEMLIDGYSTREIGPVIGCTGQNIMNIKQKIKKQLIKCGMTT